MLDVDFYHQYGPLLNELYDRIKSGETLLYSFNTGGGSSEGNTPKFENFAERFGKQRAEAIKNTKDISSFAAN